MEWFLYQLNFEIIYKRWIMKFYCSSFGKPVSKRCLGLSWSLVDSWLWFFNWIILGYLITWFFIIFAPLCHSCLYHIIYDTLSWRQTHLTWNDAAWYKSIVLSCFHDLLHTSQYDVFASYCFLPDVSPKLTFIFL